MPIQTYIPVQGMVICAEGGEFVKRTDHEDLILQHIAALNALVDLVESKFCALGWQDGMKDWDRYEDELSEWRADRDKWVSEANRLTS